MSILRILAVDDEPLALERLKVLIERQPDAKLVAVASGVESAAPAELKRQAFDLVILDIKMRDGDAFDLLNRAEMAVKPMIAFVTAFPRFAHQAFEYDAVDYLLKPVASERLGELIDKAAQRSAALSAAEKLREYESVIRQLRQDLFERSSKTYDTDIWVRRRGTERVRIPITQIDYITAVDDYAAIRSDGHEFLLRVSLDRLGESLDPAQFARNWVLVDHRPHRSGPG